MPLDLLTTDVGRRKYAIPFKRVRFETGILLCRFFTSLIKDMNFICLSILAYRAEVNCPYPPRYSSAPWPLRRTLTPFEYARAKTLYARKALCDYKVHPM
jgi:hypothetical protein